MKKKLLLTFLSGCFTIVTLVAQTKSTGAVPLGTSMSAELFLDNGNAMATLTLIGPADRWIALQFGSFGSGAGMQPGQDAVYYNGTTLVDARMTGIGGFPMTDSSNDWAVTSNTVSGGVRTIVANRSLNTGDANDYTFNYSDASIDFVYAFGSSASYAMAYHGSANRGYSLNASYTLGLEEFQGASVKVYPNPAGKDLYVEAPMSLTFLKLYDVNGKLVLVDENLSALRAVDISMLNKGVYFLEIGSDLGVLYKKLVKE